MDETRNPKPESLTIDMIAYLFVPHRDGDISSFVMRYTKINK